MNRFQEIREALGWTQRQMAAYLGFSANYYARMERGVEHPTARTQRDVEILYAVHGLCGLVGFNVENG